MADGRTLAEALMDVAYTLRDRGMLAEREVVLRAIAAIQEADAERSEAR